MHTKQQSQNSFFRTSSCAVTAALQPRQAQQRRLSASAAGMATLILAIAAVPVWSQNVPPTARQAAASPQFASRLAHPGTAPSAARAHRRASPQDNIIYSNGLCSLGSGGCTTDAWTLNFGFVTSDSITLNSGSTVTGFDFVVWQIPGDSLLSVDWSITSEPFGGTVYGSGTAATTMTLDQGINQYGYDISNYNVSGLSVAADGTVWLNLANAVVNTGDPIYWDENSGPSTAYENTLGSIPSESFDVSGNTGPPPPECVHDKPQDGFKIIHDFTVQGQGPNGVAIDQAGNLYGTTVVGGDNGLGLAYKLAPSGQDWLFTSLYSFLGGVDGQNPSPVIIGPEGALYGTAGGGIKNCGSSGDDYCGLVYRLRPSPVACLTGSCSWTEEVLYRFTGDPNGWQPSGHPVFDRAGNLYGMTLNGGAYGHGAVFELMPSSGGWTERIIYSFTGSDGDGPNSLLVGQDGNLYGTTYMGGHGGGVLFQLVPSGGGWREQVIQGFGPCTYWYGCSPFLVQESAGNLYVLDSYDKKYCPLVDLPCYWDNYGLVFMISPSDGGWNVTIIYDMVEYWWDPTWGIGDWGHDLFADLTIDAAGDLYATEGGWTQTSCGYQGGYQCWWGNVFEVRPQELRGLVHFDGDNFGALALDASGHLYGTTIGCGRYGDGTVWQLTPQP